MNDQHFKKLSHMLMAGVVLFVIGHLLFEYLNGGVKSHHLLARADLPSVSNWWELVILPALAWFSIARVRRRIAFQANHSSMDGNRYRGILIGFFGLLFISGVQSAAFELGHEIITMYLALGVLLTGLFLPIYRSECILGHVLGAAFTFGPVIPIIGISIMALISAFSNVWLQPSLVKTWVYLKGRES